MNSLFTFLSSDFLPVPLPFKYHVFLTHNWGPEESNHQRVSQVNEALQTRGILTWFDEDQMRGNIVDQMSRGIDDSMAVIVFVTNEYITKVAGQGQNGNNDNCKLEFEYACAHKRVENMIVVEMEDTKKPWIGSVGLHLGQQLYHSFKRDYDLEPCVDALVDEIENRIPK